MSLYVDHYLETQREKQKSELDRRIEIQSKALEEFELMCRVWLGKDLWTEASEALAKGEWKEDNSFYMTKRFTWGDVVGNIDMLHGSPETALLALSAGGHTRLINLPHETTEYNGWLAVPFDPLKLGEALFLAQRDAEVMKLKEARLAEEKKQEHIRTLERFLETAGSHERALQLYNKLIAEYPERMIAFYNLLTATQERLRKEAAEKAARAREKQERQAEQARLHDLARGMFEPFKVYRVIVDAGTMREPEQIAEFISDKPYPDEDGFWNVLRYRQWKGAPRVKPGSIEAVFEIKVTDIKDAFEYCRAGYLVSRKFEDIRVAYPIPLSDKNEDYLQELVA